MNGQVNISSSSSNVHSDNVTGSGGSSSHGGHGQSMSGNQSSFSGKQQQMRGLKKSQIDGQGGGGSSSNVNGRKIIYKQQNQSMISPQKKISMSQNERIPGVGGRGAASADLPNLEGGRGIDGGGAANNENSLFNKHYNKELKLCEDEIPMVLCELNDSALAYINRDQFDNALLLLQKAHGVLDVVDLSGSKRDQSIAFQLFHNMAMCYQKQGQLEECALCLETTLDNLGKSHLSLKTQSIAGRIFKLKTETKLRLQFCAILSQLHRHKDALEQAQEGIKLAHMIVRDQISLCRLYSKRMEIIANYPGGLDPNRNLSDSQSGSEAGDNKSRGGSKTIKIERGNSGPRKTHNQSRSSMIFDEEEETADLAQLDFENISVASLGQFQSKQSFHNNLEESISLIEKTSVKLQPIYQEILRKIQVIEKRRKLLGEGGGKDDKNADVSLIDGESSDIESKIGLGMPGGDHTKKAGKNNQPSQRKKATSKKKDGKTQKKNNVDLRHILGFLNQTEWIQNLNIGNIMQISPVKLEDVSQIRRNEDALSRDHFLEVISFLIVGYFCASTEIRFIIQLKDEIGKFHNFQVDQKTQESELWHTLSLEVACSFLPSDCPLLNHILLSYQKHHAPSQTQIPENQVLEEKIRVIKPLVGIDNSKFQPIVRELQHVRIELDLAKVKPAQKTVTKMLREVGHAQSFHLAHDIAHSYYMQGGGVNPPGAQQSQNRKTPSNKLKNHQVQKLLKLEKMVRKFSMDIGIDKGDMLRMLLGQQNEGSQKGFMRETPGKHNNAEPIPINGARPKSHQEQLNSRQNLESLNTGMAAKIAYNNIKKFVDQAEVNQTMVTHYSQNSGGSHNSQGWKMSPSSNMQSRNVKPLSNNGGSGSESQPQVNRESSEPSSRAMPLKSKGKSIMQGPTTHGGDKRIYDSDGSSHRDNSFLNDLSQLNLRHHDKSYNEQLDDKSKFLLNQNDDSREVLQHHNLSIGALGSKNGHGPNHSGSVRQQKRIHSQERAKIQRPRSSKGYRAGQSSSQMQPIGSAGQSHSHVGTINMSHQLSDNHLPMHGSNAIHQSSSMAQKIHSSKSEDRVLKSQQNQRQILGKNQRQKSTLTHGMNIPSHTSTDFNKDHMMQGVSQNQKNIALGSINSQMQSQSSQQLPSTSATTNFSKLSKKQIQILQQQQAQHQQALLANLGNGQGGSSNMNQQIHLGSLNNINKNSKMKLNYEDLKKFLIKDYTASQSQQVLAQLANSGQLNTNQQSQNSLGGPNASNIGSFDISGLQSSGKGRGGVASSAAVKTKKMVTQSQQQLASIPNNHQSIQNMTNFDKFDQLQANMEGLGGGSSLNQGVGQLAHNKDLKDLINSNPDLLQMDRDRSGISTKVNSSTAFSTNSQVLLSSQQKKAKQILAQARKSSANNTNGNGPNNISLIQNLNQNSQHALMQQQQQQTQQYLNSIQSSLNNRPSSSTKNNSKQQSSHSSALPSGSRQSQQNHNQTVSQHHNMSSGTIPHQSNREKTSKSTLGILGNGGTTSQPLLVQNQQNLGGDSRGSSTQGNSIKRREKGRLIMQEWLTKNGQNGQINGHSGHNSQSQQPFNIQQQQQIMAQASQNNSALKASNGSKGKQNQQQSHMGLMMSSAQFQLTKQQQAQLQQIQLTKQNSGQGGGGLSHQSAMSTGNNLIGGGPSSSNSNKFVGLMESNQPQKPVTSQEARRKSQPM